MLFGNHGLNKPICFGLVLFSFIVVLCIVSFQNIPSIQNGMTKSPEFSVFSDRTVNCSTTIVEKIVEKPLFVEKIVEKPLNVESKQGWRHFWTVFFANKNTR